MARAAACWSVGEPCRKCEKSTAGTAIVDGGEIKAEDGGTGMDDVGEQTAWRQSSWIDEIDIQFNDQDRF
jgi:hypothetical protein